MRNIEPFEFKPEYQVDESDPISFCLKPLDLRGQYEIQMSIGENGIPSWSGIEAASRYICGWSGAGMGEFSKAKLREIISGGADSAWMIWIGSVAGKLYTESLLSEEDRKKS